MKVLLSDAADTNKKKRDTKSRRMIGSLHHFWGLDSNHGKIINTFDTHAFVPMVSSVSCVR